MMSVAWLVPLEPAASALRARAGLRELAVDTRDMEACAERLAGLEIIVTSELAVDARLLGRCRWIRAVVGVGPRAGGLVDRTFAASRGLLSGIIDTDAGEAAALDVLVATLARMERQLRVYDDIAETWEGT